jgi:hypothetical protein
MKERGAENNLTNKRRLFNKLRQYENLNKSLKNNVHTKCRSSF